MSMEHIISLVVARELKRDLLISLFEHAQVLGIQTLEYSFDIAQRQNKLISPEDSATIILEEINNIENDRSVYLKKDDAWIFMSASQLDHLYTKISFSGFKRQWQKEYISSIAHHKSINHIDLARYCRLILKLFEKNEIIDLKIEYI